MLREEGLIDELLARKLVKAILEADRGTRAEAARIDGDMAAAQRLGFLFQQVGAAAKTEPLLRWIEAERPRVVSLRSDRPMHPRIGGGGCW